MRATTAFKLGSCSESLLEKLPLPLQPIPSLFPLIIYKDYPSNLPPSFISLNLSSLSTPKGSKMYFFTCYIFRCCNVTLVQSYTISLFCLSQLEGIQTTQ